MIKKIFHLFPSQREIIFALLCLCGIVLGCIYFERVYADRVFPGVTLVSQPVGGMTRDELQTFIAQKQDALEKNGITVVLKNRRATILPDVVSLDPDISVTTDQIYGINEKETFERIWLLGRNGTPTENAAQQITALLFKHTEFFASFISEKEFAETLHREFITDLKEGTDAQFALDPSSHEITIVPEKDGTTLENEAAFNALRRGIEKGSVSPITLGQTAKHPSVLKKDLQPLLKDASRIVNHAPLTLRILTTQEILSRDDVLNFLSVTRDSTIHLTINEVAITSLLQKKFTGNQFLDPFIRYTIVDNRLSPLNTNNTKKTIDINQSTTLIKQTLESDTQNKELDLILIELASPTADVPQSELLEIVADEMTDFKGSPSNRKKNITLGMQKMNGILIPKGSNFSLIGALGKIDEDSGFLPELVIKGNKTTPEFGGGLCQVSTTLFRAVAMAGLPVLERKNHSYRVSYYEPPVGFDATIYFPKPDFRFKNDLPGQLLIQAWVEGTKAHVRLWGTKDNRTIENDKPVISNIKKPGETKIIETDELLPGKKKCTERAHNGADAVFERRVTYPDGTLKKDVFKSHYVVWPAVCLVGKAAPTAPVSPATPPSETTASPPQVEPEKIIPLP